MRRKRGKPSLTRSERASPPRAPWGESFASLLQAAVGRVLSCLPASLEHRVHLLGVARAGGDARTPWIEPADPEIVAAFADLGARLAREERAQRRARGGTQLLYREEILARLAAQTLAGLPRDVEARVFCGNPVLTRGALCLPIVEVDADAFARLPALPVDREGQRHGVYGFAEAVLHGVLREVEQELSKPRPGQSASFLDVQGVLRGAAAALVFEVALCAAEVGDAHALFDRLNVVSAARYEHRASRGSLVLARPDHPAVRVALRLAQPVPLGEAAWSRKLLEVASDDVALLCDGAWLYGLGEVARDLDATAEDVFLVRFVDHYKWELLHDERVLLRVEYGSPALPAPRMARGRFHRALRAVFPTIDPDALRPLYRIVEVATEQPHGAMVVVSAAAAAEAERLSTMATRVEPVALTVDLVRRVTSIDGALLLDPDGLCHAVGLILDGRAAGVGSPSRGSRYNSAHRYVAGATAPTLVVVVSEDGRVDLIPEPAA